MSLLRVKEGKWVLRAVVGTVAITSHVGPFLWFSRLIQWPLRTIDHSFCFIEQIESEKVGWIGAWNGDVSSKRQEGKRRVPVVTELLEGGVAFFSSFSRSFKLMTVANFLFLLFFLSRSFPGVQVNIIFSPVMWTILGSVVMLPYGVINCTFDWGRKRVQKNISLKNGNYNWEL